MSSTPIFCCSSASPYKSKTLSHEGKFRQFIAYANYRKESSITNTEPILAAGDTTFVIQLVRQVNHGPLESKRYFVQVNDGFMEVKEDWMVNNNFKKLNT
jgi:hypothetical protein